MKTRQEQKITARRARTKEIRAGGPGQGDQLRAGMICRFCFLCIQCVHKVGHGCLQELGRASQEEKQVCEE